ncbi:helix-turn-helix domain-containing protein [Kitasatospora sp. NPDC006697]|uniref:helix-turn-helix domain-containing protein n=1 Tax=Kitasatospora sp. NPDC006697 TaxID=3364020 RepID=UPI0036995255
MNHSQWKTARTRALLGEQVEEGPTVTAWRRENRYAFAFGQALYDRRTELGLTEEELANRIGLTLEQVEEIEGGAVVPTLSMLEQLAVAMDAELDIHLVPGTVARLRFPASAA